MARLVCANAVGKLVLITSRSSQSIASLRSLLKWTLMRFFGHNLVSFPSLPIRLSKLSDTPISVYDPKACKCGLVRVL